MTQLSNTTQASNNPNTMIASPISISRNTNLWSIDERINTPKRVDEDGSLNVYFDACKKHMLDEDDDHEDADASSIRSTDLIEDPIVDPFYCVDNPMGWDKDIETNDDEGDLDTEIRYGEDVVDVPDVAYTSSITNKFWYT
jgi:hypothetical protein